ncbi:MAG: hypothetical protein GQ582_09365 [Methyloprofundus sp.]|nr:hypothetical protein [Methyloprofundus sp.]
MFNFLPGIIMIQLVTSALLLMGFNWSGDIQLVIVIIVIALIFSVLAAVWFTSIAKDLYIDDQAILMEGHAHDREQLIKEHASAKEDVLQEHADLRDQHAREREEILLDAERDKADTVAESHRKIAEESRKTHAKANFKVGAAFAVAVGAGGIMVVSQLVTLGMMVMVASGSGLGGYILRARHDQLSRKKQLALAEEKKRLEHTVVASTPVKYLD